VHIQAFLLLYSWCESRLWLFFYLQLTISGNPLLDPPLICWVPLKLRTKGTSLQGSFNTNSGSFVFRHYVSCNIYTFCSVSMLVVLNRTTCIVAAAVRQKVHFGPKWYVEQWSWRLRYVVNYLEEKRNIIFNLSVSCNLLEVAI